MNQDTIPLIFGLLCGGILALAALGVGIALIVLGVRTRKKTQASQSWSSTVGEITRAEVRTNISTDSEGDTTYSYVPSVEYVYQVEGTPYTGKAIAFGASRSYSNRTKAEAQLGKYPVGGRVTVYYNPENPGEAVLERQAVGTNFMTIGGVVLIVVGLCVTCGLLIAMVSNLRG